mgnify:CR=1 FL=1
MLVNLTPHILSVHAGSDVPVAISPSGFLARVAVTLTPCGTIEGFPLVSRSYGDVTGLPDPIEGTTYVVSAMVLEALKGSRPDVVAPGDSVRVDGVIVGCRGFAINK